MSDELDVQRSKDAKGRFYRAGDDGRKFYYEPGNASSRGEAKRLASREARKEADA